MEGEKVIVRKIGVSSLGKLAGSVQAIIGIAVGVIASVVAVVSVISNNDYGILTDILVSAGIVIASVIVWPLVLFLGGWLYGALVALIVNSFIGVSGGIELTVDKEASSKK